MVKELKRFNKHLNGNPIYSKNIVNVQLDLEKERLVSKILLSLKFRLFLRFIELRWIFQDTNFRKRKKNAAFTGRNLKCKD